MPTTTPGIRQTKRGWEVSASKNGRRKTALVQTKAQAISRRKELQLQLEDLQKPVAYCLGEAAKASLRGRWAQSASIATTESNLNQCLNFLGADLPLEELDEEMVLGLREHFLSINGNATVNKKLCQLKSVLIDAHKRGKLAALPSWWPTRLKVDTVKDRVISEKEHQGFVAWFRVHAGEEIADMYEFMLDTCARWGDVRGLRSEQVCLDSNTVTYEKRKANNVSSIPLTGRARTISQQYVHRDGLLFSERITYRVFRSRFQAAKEAMGITDPRLTIHSTRHTTASKLISANVADPLVMAFGGWSDPRSMKRYLHLRTEALAPCVEALER